jgi:LytS/YehU family sensor histidine kinase
MSLTSGLFNPKNRFGFHKAFLQAQSADFADRHKAPCYIPTRLEVYRMPMAELQPILQNWFNHAPAELAPSAQQRKAVMDLLRMRSDREQIAPVIAVLYQTA